MRAVGCERDEQHLAGALDTHGVDAAECVRQPLDSLEAAVGAEGADAVDEVPLGRRAQLELADRRVSRQLEAQHRRAARAVVGVVALGCDEDCSAFADRDAFSVGDPAAVCVPQLVRGGDLRIRAAVRELEHEQLARSVVHGVGVALLVEVDARDVAVEGAGGVSCDDLVESPRPRGAVDGFCLAGFDVGHFSRGLARDGELTGHVGDAAPRGDRVAFPRGLVDDVTVSVEQCDRVVAAESEACVALLGVGVDAPVAAGFDLGALGEHEGLVRRVAVDDRPAGEVDRVLGVGVCKLDPVVDGVAVRLDLVDHDGALDGLDVGGVVELARRRSGQDESARAVGDATPGVAVACVVGVCVGIDDFACSIEEIDLVAASEAECEGLFCVALSPEEEQLAGLDRGAGLESAAVVVAVGVVVGEGPVAQVDSRVARVDELDEVVALRVDLIDGDA